MGGAARRGEQERLRGGGCKRAAPGRQSCLYPLPVLLVLLLRLPNPPPLSPQANVTYGYAVQGLSVEPQAGTAGRLPVSLVVNCTTEPDVRRGELPIAMQVVAGAGAEKGGWPWCSASDFRANPFISSQIYCLPRGPAAATVARERGLLTGHSGSRTAFPFAMPPRFSFLCPPSYLLFRWIGFTFLSMVLLRSFHAADSRSRQGIVEVIVDAETFSEGGDFLLLRYDSTADLPTSPPLRTA